MVIGGVLVAVLALLLVLGLTGEDSGSPEPARETTTETTGGGGDRAQERARERRRERRERERRRRERPTSVRLRVAPEEPTYVCVDRGRPPVVFEGTLTRARTFTGRRLRINLGRPSTRLTVNGRGVPVRGGADPVGFAFSPGARPRPLPAGRRPCA